MEIELYAEAHMADMRRIVIAVDTHGWKQLVLTPSYRAAITSAVIDSVTAHPYRLRESPDRAGLER